jgi:hypothetical protein
MSVIIDGSVGITVPDGEVYAEGNILGTVSQSSGVPTGAVIERGSNANGEFVKYADGTLICTKFFERGVETPVSNNTYTFSSTFQSVPVCYFSLEKDTNSLVFSNVYTYALTSTYKFYFTFSSGGAFGGYLLAIGRWF